MENQNGVKQVRFRHYRIPVAYFPWHILSRYRRGKPEFEPASKGGLTVCEIDWEDGTHTRGEALCSVEDQFCYRIGRELAIERAKTAYENGAENLGPTKLLHREWLMTFEVN